MESPNVLVDNKAAAATSSFSIKSVGEMDHSLVVDCEATGNVSGKNSEEVVGGSSIPGGSSFEGVNVCEESNPEVNSLNSNEETPLVALVTSRDSPKVVDLGESNLEVNSYKAEDETPLIVLDPINVSSEEENLDDSNLGFNSPNPNTGEIPLLVQDPSQDSDKDKILEDSDVEVLPVEPAEASEMANAEQDDEEYACKYCHRKFTNKQSLGGHQNAHKFERALEKDASDAHGSGVGYFNVNGTSSYPKVASPLSSYPGSLKRSYEFMNKPLQINRPYQPSQQMLQHNQGLMHAARPMLPSMMPQVVPHHFHEFYRGYQPGGWNVPMGPRTSTLPVPRVSPIAAAQNPYLPSVGLTLQFPNQGAPSSSSRHIYQGFSAFPEIRSSPGRNAHVPNNNQRNVPGNEEDDAGLDLTLRL